MSHMISKHLGNQGVLKLHTFSFTTTENENINLMIYKGPVDN